ncbi:MAG: STAS domain-containing protein [Pirellulales bacterium]|nr:STAS domain-containing protein [Pirellulales bacterium]
MELQNERHGASLVVRVSGRLDADSTPAFEVHCRQAIAEGERALILDLAPLEYISSAGLRGVLAVAKTVAAAGGEFALANARGLVRQVLDISGFLGMFRLLDSLDTPAA